MTLIKVIILTILITSKCVHSTPMVKTLTNGDAEVDAKKMDAESDAKDTEIFSSQFDVREKNWEITQKWLINSINQLRSEINDLGHNYNVHVKTTDADVDKNQASFVHDIAVLRADHTILANQQKLIIKLIKERPNYVLQKLISPVIVNKLPENERQVQGKESKDGQSEGKAGHDDGQNGQVTGKEGKTDDEEEPRHVKKKDKGKRRHRKRHPGRRPKMDLLFEKEEKMEEKVEKMTRQVDALHDITLALFHGVQDIEKREGAEEEEQKKVDGAEDKINNDDNEDAEGNGKFLES